MRTVIAAAIASHSRANPKTGTPSTTAAAVTVAAPLAPTAAGAWVANRFAAVTD